MLYIDKNIFLSNLRLTQLYCQLQTGQNSGTIAQVLRSYNPIVGNEPLFSFTHHKLSREYLGITSYMETQWLVDPVSPDNIIQSYFEEQLEAKRIVQPADNGQLPKGDILVSQIDCTLTDGASEAESFGFINVYDLPPIDTWFYITIGSSSRLLLSWIPEAYVQHAHRAALVNCVDCFGWFRKWYPTDYKKLLEE